MGTPYQLSCDGMVVDSICRCGRNAPMSLPHIAQICGIVSGLRTKRHDNVVVHVAQIFKRHVFDVMETRFQTERGVGKPDLVTVTSKELTVLDVQIRSNSVVCSLDSRNKEKIENFLDAVRDRYGPSTTIRVVALTYN